MIEHRCTAILLAAGKGLRVGGEISKQYIEMHDAPIYIHSVRTMAECPVITDFVLMCPAGDEEKMRETVAAYGLSEKLRAVVPGGFERFHSVHLGLEAISWPCDYVFIHDCARPFLDQETLGRLYQAVQACDACVAGMPVKDTVRISGPDGYAVQTPKRSDVWMIQTPQVFAYELVRDAHRKVMKELDNLREAGITITDDAMVVECMTGRKIRLIEASYRNIKITTPEDLPLAEALFRG